MRQSLSIASAFLASLLLALPAAAQPAGAGGGFAGPPRPNLDLARQAAEAAVKACERMGFKTMATVVDATGQPVVAMTADPQLNKALAPESVKRARIAARFHTASSDIVDRVGLDAGIYYMVQTDAKLRAPKPGGVPFGGLGSAVRLVVAGGVADLDQPQPLVLGHGLLVLGVQVVEPRLQQCPDLLDLLRRTRLGGAGTFTRDDRAVDEHVLTLPFPLPRPCRWTPPTPAPASHRGARRYPPPKIPNGNLAKK